MSLATGCTRVWGVRVDSGIWMRRKGSAEHSMAMRSGAIKHHVLHEIWLGVTINREGFGRKKTTAPALLQPFLSSLPASSPSPLYPKYPIPGIHPPTSPPSTPIPEGWMSLPEQSGPRWRSCREPAAGASAAIDWTRDITDPRARPGPRSGSFVRLRTRED